MVGGSDSCSLTKTMFDPRIFEVDSVILLIESISKNTRPFWALVTTEGYPSLGLITYCHFYQSNGWALVKSTASNQSLENW